MRDLLVGCGQLTWTGASRRIRSSPRSPRPGTTARRPVARGATTEEVGASFARHGLRPSARLPRRLPLAARGAGGDPRAGTGAGGVRPRPRPRRALRRAEPDAGAAGGRRAGDAGRLARRGRLPPDGRHAESDRRDRARGGRRACFHNHVGSPSRRAPRSTGSSGSSTAGSCSRGRTSATSPGRATTPSTSAATTPTRSGRSTLKDIDPRVLEGRPRRHWDYAGFSDHGIFAELGEGMIDFPAMFAALPDTGAGSIVETDVTTKPSALESARISRAYLRSIGV